MKKPVLLTLAVMPLLFSGCDFIRTLTGRPTSSELQQMREAALKEERKRQVVEEPLDSLAEELAENSTEDLTTESTQPLTPSTSPVPPTEPVSKKYYIVVGSYHIRSNAENTADRYRDKGYEAVILSFSNSQAVGICPSDNLEEAQRKRRELIKEKACPASSWIHQKK